MKGRFFAIALAVAAAPAAATPAAAVPGPLAVSSYSMPNGSGTASGGSNNYWDKSYSGTGNSMVDGAFLSGGAGDLTDGVIASGNWLAVENPAGTGPYVGWHASTTLNPLVTFYFPRISRVNAIAVHVDNSTVGGVLAPASIEINGVLTAFTAPPSGTVGFINFTGLNLVGDNLSLRFNQINNSALVFVSEVSFSGSVPEPQNWVMLITGFGMIGAIQRRKRPVIS